MKQRIGHDLDKRVAKDLDAYPGIAAIYFFGSIAAGRATDLSDLDVAILFQKGCVPDAMGLLDLRERLSGLTGLDVDVVRLDGHTLQGETHAAGDGPAYICARQARVHFAKDGKKATVDQIVLLRLRSGPPARQLAQIRPGKYSEAVPVAPNECHRVVPGILEPGERFVRHGGQPERIACAMQVLAFRARARVAQQGPRQFGGRAVFEFHDQHPALVVVHHAVCLRHDASLSGQAQGLQTGLYTVARR